MISFQILIRQLSLQISLENRIKGFFRTFLQIKKSATIDARSRSRVPPRSSSSTPRPHDADFYIKDEDAVGHGPMEDAGHRYSCGPALGHDSGGAPVSVLRRWWFSVLGRLGAHCRVVDVPVVMILRGAYDVVEETHASPTRGVALFALGFWTIFLLVLCIWLALGPQSTVAFERISVLSWW